VPPLATFARDLARFVAAAFFLSSESVFAFASMCSARAALFDLAGIAGARVFFAARSLS